MLVFFTSSSLLKVQAQKIAHINFQELVYSMPESKTIKDSLSRIEGQWQQILQEMEMEYQKKVNEFEEKKATWPPQYQAQKQKDIQELRYKIETQQNVAQESYQEMQENLLRPLIAKAKEAINVVAKELGYATVLDSSSGILLVSSATDDIMSQVRKKMGITAPPPAAPQPGQR